MEFIKIAEELGVLSEKQISELKEVFEEVDRDTTELLVKSYLGMFFDSICKDFGLDENATWQQVFEAHQQINEIDGDF